MRIPIALLAATLSVSPAAASGLGIIEMNRPFPDLMLPDLETGEPTSLARFRGERVVLQVFASW